MAQIVQLDGLAERVELRTAVKQRFVAIECATGGRVLIANKAGASDSIATITGRVMRGYLRRPYPLVFVVVDLVDGKIAAQASNMRESPGPLQLTLRGRRGR
jgi:hypothetical protein